MKRLRCKRCGGYAEQMDVGPGVSLDRREIDGVLSFLEEMGVEPTQNVICNNCGSTDFEKVDS